MTISGLDRVFRMSRLTHAESHQVWPLGFPGLECEGRKMDEDWIAQISVSVDTGNEVLVGVLPESFEGKPVCGNEYCQ